MVVRILIFLVLNFAGLAIGGQFTGSGVASEWYAELNKAPWTPPGWLFGVAWTTIMICFSVYMAILWKRVSNKSQLVLLYGLSWILNVAWNPLFFYFQWVDIALVAIISLTVTIGIITTHYHTLQKRQTLWIAPYLIWIILATSLNLYISLMN